MNEGLTTEEWETVQQITALATNTVLLRFGRFVEAEDVRQECLLAVAAKEGKVVGWIRQENNSEVKRGERSLLKFLQKKAEVYARKQKAETLGYEIEDEYFYQAGLIEALIAVMSPGDYDLAGQILDPADVGGRRKKTLASEGNNIIALVSDASMAFKTLDGRDQQILMLKFGGGLSSQEIADQMGVTRQRIDQLLRRGVRKMIEALGGADPRS